MNDRCVSLRQQARIRCVTLTLPLMPRASVPDRMTCQMRRELSLKAGRRSALINRTQYLGASLLLLFGLAIGSALAVTTAEKVKTEGLIVARQHDSVSLRTADQGNLVVVMTDYTKTSHVSCPHSVTDLQETNR